MTARFATKNEIKTWDESIISNPDGGNIFQSVGFNSIKEEQGWKVRNILTDRCAVTVLERYIPLLGRYWYVPKGPGLTDASSVIDILAGIKKIAIKSKVFMIKIEPELKSNSNTHKELNNAGLVHTNGVQPNGSTVIIDLKPSINEILANLPQKGRHAIRRAMRDGAVSKLVEPSDENLKIMLELLKETMTGKGTLIRSDEYYLNFWRVFSAAGIGKLFFTYNNDKPVAGAYVLVFGKKATYKDGGSVKEKSVYGASHALQWKIIEWLKDNKIESYDLCGSPHSSKIHDRNHPYYGIGLFKTSLNKQITDYIGAYDIIIKPLAYKIWTKIAQRLVMAFYSRVLRTFFY